MKDLNTLQDTTGVSGELDVSVEAPDLTDPATIEWMAAFKKRVLEAGGFGGENPSCLEAEICPGPALSDFLVRGGGKLTKSGIEATLGALSSYALRQVAPLDPKTGKVGHRALLSFGIRAQSLEDQQALIDRVRRPGRHPGRARRAAGGGRRPPRRAAGDRRRRGQRPLRQPLLAQPRRAARGGARPARRLPLALAGAAAAGADRAGDRVGGAGCSGSAASR